MRITLSTPRRLARARVTRRPRSSRIGAVDGASRAMANPTAAAQMANLSINPTAVVQTKIQITNPIMDAMVGVQTASEVANVSTRLVTEFGQAVISHMT